MSRSELDFTGTNNPDCRHAQWWTAPDAHATECEVTELVAGWVRALQPQLVVETGSYYGHTTWAIAEALRRNGHGRLTSLECNPDLAERAAARVAELGTADVLCTNSLEWTPPGAIDFCWFDSSLETREAEFRRFYPYLRGAFVGFHDTGRHHQVVREAVLRLADEGLLQPLFLPTPRGVAFANVT